MKMINIYISKDSDKQQQLKSTLEDMVIAHQVNEVEHKNELPPSLVGKENLPILIDGEDVVQGQEEIHKYLEKLKTFKQEWDKFQSDACYCDDEGEVE
jgi:hypothetical protein